MNRAVADGTCSATVSRNWLVCWNTNRLLCWHTNRLTGVLTHQQTNKCADTPTDWLVCWHTNRLVCWHTNWLVCWHSNRLIGVLTHQQTDWCADTPTDTDWCADTPTDWLHNKQSPSGQADTSSARQEILHIVWKLCVHYRAHNSPTVFSNLRQINSLQTLPSYLVLYCYLHFVFQVVSFRLISPQNICLTTVRAASSTRLILIG